jgi:hypothetical protein
MKKTKVGSFKHHFVQVDNSIVNVTLKQINYVPGLKSNLFRISKALKNGFDLRNQGLMISLKKESISVTFDGVIKTVNGSISGINMITYDPSVSYILKGTSNEIKQIDVNKFHISSMYNF